MDEYTGPCSSLARAGTRSGLLWSADMQRNQLLSAFLVIFSLACLLISKVGRRDWLSTLPAAHRRVTSQGGQDDVIAAVFAGIGTTNRLFVEFGFDSATLEGGGRSNTLQLRLAGWQGLLLDAEHSNQ